MKEKLLSVISAARAREAELVGEMRDATADPQGRWHAKDHLAHLAWWREHNAARTLDAIRLGVEPPRRVEDDKQNAQIYGATKDLTVAAISEGVARSWVAFEEAVVKCTEEDLQKPHPSFAGSHAWEIVPGHAGHVGTHLMWWHLEHGDVERAEAAELWAHAVESDAFPEPAKRADADYNLACFYSRVGRVDSALDLLRGCFAAKPELKDLARKDPDFGPIREDLAPILL